MQDKLKKLDAILDSLGRCAVAFSGGVDSTFLAKYAHDRLGTGVIAITADSPLVPADEISATRAFAAAERIEHEVIAIDIFRNSAVISNPPDRCYHCKLDIFRAILACAASKGIARVIEGSNLDDRDDYRPGMRALAELGIRSPLMEAGLTKDEIRAAARRLGIAVWDRPATPCLATRIPTGVGITREMLDAVNRAETLLRSLGFPDVRVRHHGSLARIEVPAGERRRLLDAVSAAGTAERLKSFGFRYITLDIEGYRRGSMNKPTGEDEGDGQG